MNPVAPRVNTQKHIFSCSAPRPQRRGPTFHGPRPQMVVGVCHARVCNRSCTRRRFALPRPEPTHPQDASAPPRYSASASAPQIGGVALAGCPAGDHEVTAAGAPPNGSGVAEGCACAGTRRARRRCVRLRALGWCPTIARNSSARDAPCLGAVPQMRVVRPANHSTRWVNESRPSATSSTISSTSF